jgi:predicted nucleic acid-binding protein
MAKIFIDTNVFLDFYESSRQTLKVLLELHKHSDSVVFPRLVYDEFLRRRVGVLKKVITGIKGEYHTYTTAIIQDLEGFNSLKEVREKHKEQLRIVEDSIKEIINDTHKDSVFSEVTSLFQSKDVKIFEYDNDIIQKANKRHLLGQPPGTDKVNICDEVIWEAILSNIDDDIIIVSRDGTYRDNYFYLNFEFKDKIDRELLKVCDKITEGIKLLGETVPPEIIELEGKQIDALTREKFLDDLFDAEWIGFSSSIKAKSGGWDPNLNKYEWHPGKDGYMTIDSDGAKMISSLDFDITKDRPDDAITTARKSLDALIKAYKATTESMRKKDRKEDQDPKTKSEDTEE